MPYELELLDGTVIRGIPDHVQPQAVVDQQGQDKEANKTEEGFETAAAGFGRSASNIGRNVGNLLGMDEYSDEALEESRRLDEGLLDTNSGMAGNIAGDIASLVVPGGALLKGSKLARAMAKKNPITTATGVGATEGYAVSDPSNRKSSVAMGAAGGGLARAVLGAGSRASKGVVDRTDEAKQMMQELGVDSLPVSAGAKPGIVQKVYRDILPALPGGRKLVDESQSLFKRVRKKASEKAVPPGQTIADLTGDVQSDIGKLQNSWATAWDEVEGIPVSLKDTPKLQALLQSNKDAAAVAKQFMSPGGVISSEGVMAVRNLLREGSGEMGRLSSRQADSIMKEALDSTAIPGLHDKFKGLGEAWENMRALESTVKTAAGKSGKYTPEQLASSAANLTSRADAATGKGTFQRLANLTSEGLGDEMKDPGFWRTIATLGLTVGGGIGGGPLGAAGMFAAIRAAPALMGSKAMQKAMQGDLGWQQKIAKKIADNPEMAQELTNLITQASAIGAADVSR